MRHSLGLLALLCSLTTSSATVWANEGPTATAESNADAPATVAVPDLTGCWSGTWCSHKNGHHGPMKATFTPIGDCCYQVRVRGRFMGILPFAYTTNLRVTHGADGTAYLAGQHHLPLFGNFSMSASATDCQFVANFCAKNDHGVFNLQRVSR